MRWARAALGTAVALGAVTGGSLLAPFADQAPSATSSSLGAALAAEDEPAVRGRALFTQHCSICHVMEGVPGGVTIGPNLSDYGSRPLIAGAEPNTAENLVRWLMNPQSLMREATMPALGLSTAQASDLAAFLLPQPLSSSDDAAEAPTE